MTQWFLRGLRRGVVTTHYPSRPEPSVALLPSPPVFRAELLTVELIIELEAVCPSRALSRDQDTLVYDVGACTSCGRCFPVAGPAARPSRSIELAATSRECLIKRIPLIKEDT